LGGRGRGEGLSPLPSLALCTEQFRNQQRYGKYIKSLPFCKRMTKSCGSNKICPKSKIYSERKSRKALEMSAETRMELSRKSSE
jgi:hypothetical protein